MPAEAIPLEPPMPVLDVPAQEAPLQELAVAEAPPSVQQRVKSALPWLASLTVNLAILLLLALLESAGLLKSGQVLVEVEASFEQQSEETLVDLPELSVATASEATASLLAAPAEAVEPLATTTPELSQELLPSNSAATFDTAVLDVPQQQRKGGLMGLPNSSDLSALVPTTTARGPVTEKELKERTSLTDVAMQPTLFRRE